ncbi:unnamed protein product [Diplocarpon coronariae]|uniref:N-acetyltransferase GCN n=1 Tax=Diplocarpon coronariae TaxID=2795749 RepID=A0A218ZG34_9HELO|nr:N-acetyltransferase GCN [Marssonina coronariae]
MPSITKCLGAWFAKMLHLPPLQVWVASGIEVLQPSGSTARVRGLLAPSFLGVFAHKPSPLFQSISRSVEHGWSRHHRVSHPARLTSRPMQPPPGQRRPMGITMRNLTSGKEVY